MTQTRDNTGLGALYATFNIHKTGGNYDLTNINVGDAVSLSGNNEVGLGLNGGLLLGRLEHVGGELITRATVQIAGVARFDIDSQCYMRPTPRTMPALGNRVVVNGVGKVYQVPAIDGLTGIPAGGSLGRGTVIAVDSENRTCDVFLC